MTEEECEVPNHSTYDIDQRREGRVEGDEGDYSVRSVMRVVLLCGAVVLWIRYRVGPQGRHRSNFRYTVYAH